MVIFPIDKEHTRLVLVHSIPYSHCHSDSAVGFRLPLSSELVDPRHLHCTLHYPVAFFMNLTSSPAPLPRPVAQPQTRKDDCISRWNGTIDSRRLETENLLLTSPLHHILAPFSCVCRAVLHFEELLNSEATACRRQASNGRPERLCSAWLDYAA